MQSASITLNGITDAALGRIFEFKAKNEQALSVSPGQYGSGGGTQFPDPSLHYNVILTSVSDLNIKPVMSFVLTLLP